MISIGLVLTAVAALVHVFIFYLESLAWTSPRARRIFGVATLDDAESQKELAFNQGFYNLFLAIITAVGIAAFSMGPPRRWRGTRLQRRRQHGCGGNGALALEPRQGLRSAQAGRHSTARNHHARDRPCALNSSPGLPNWKNRALLTVTASVNYADSPS